jgi:hypothetical protein
MLVYFAPFLLCKIRESARTFFGSGSGISESIPDPQYWKSVANSLLSLRVLPLPFYRAYRKGILCMACSIHTTVLKLTYFCYPFPLRLVCCRISHSNRLPSIRVFPAPLSQRLEDRSVPRDLSLY